ncbi:hypothetical protein J4446_02295 [Candidatus Woesearchaeota archaeon]|nr:hypothetical protein [Candidatus Woesearchaeota archaeon]
MNHSSNQNPSNNFYIFDETGRTRSYGLYDADEVTKGMEIKRSIGISTSPSIINYIFPFLLKNTSAVACADRKIEEILSTDGLSVAVITRVERVHRGMLEMDVDFYGNASVN